MAKELTGKEIFIKILTSINMAKAYYDNETIGEAIEQYNELRKLKMFNRYPEIKGVNDNDK